MKYRESSNFKDAFCDLCKPAKNIPVNIRNSKVIRKNRNYNLISPFSQAPQPG